MTDIIESYFKAIGASQAFLNSVQPLSAIWLPYSVQTATKRTVRIEPGMKVKLIGNNIVDCIDAPTHEILECFGAQNYSIKVKNIESGKKETIYLPNF